MDSPPDQVEPVHLADLVTAAAVRVPDHPAVVDVTSGVTLTWADVEEAGAAEAARLLAAGVAVGDRVVVRLPNGAAFCVALLGALRAGATVVPFGPIAVPRELEIVFDECRPSVVVAPEGDAAAAAAAAGSGARLLGPPDLTARPPGALGSGPIAGGEDIALLVYTSGTTGTPRGVRLSHRALLANRRQTAALRPAPVTPVDRVLLALPMFHIFGLGAGFLQVCWTGATVVLTESLDPAHLADVILEQRVSTVAGVPSLFRSLLDLPAERLRAVTGGVRMCTSGGAPLPPGWSAEFRAATGLSIVERYGLTEAGPVVTSNLVDGVAKAGSVGRPLPGVELRVVEAADRAGIDADIDTAAGDGGADVDDLDDDPGVDFGEYGTVLAGQLAGGFDPSQDTGLVTVRGPNLFSGYWPDGAGGPDAEGWFRTVDVGFLDADGDLHLVDRSSDLVIVSGFNVYPREVEQVLVELAGVAEAAVVGVPDDRTGEAVKAVLVSKEGVDLTADAVRAHCVERLAPFKVPAVIEFAEALPRTPTGKIARRLLAGRS